MAKRGSHRGAILLFAQDGTSQHSNGIREDITQPGVPSKDPELTRLHPGAQAQADNRRSVRIRQLWSVYQARQRNEQRNAGHWAERFAESLHYSEAPDNSETGGHLASAFRVTSAAWKWNRRSQRKKW